MILSRAFKRTLTMSVKRKELIVDCEAVAVADIRVPRQLPHQGVASRNMITTADSVQERCYLSTAINYTNGFPHIGHAYEVLVTDVIARQNRMFGSDVFFCTGTDEHGQKIAATAEAAGISAMENCTKYKDGFVALNERLEISNDMFIRTTDASHKETAQKLWELCKANGDIYLDSYEGYYLVRDERYVTEQEALEWDYKDPVSGVALTKMSEESYFFRLSKYHNFLLDKIKSDPEFISPSQYRGEIIARLEREPLRDLSISRTSFDWGIPVPGDSKHVMYVWFDALTNYLSAVDGVNSVSKFWPCDAHVIGKDIIWFHCVIWPAMLKSAGLPLPKKVLVHGFVLDKDGKKMSKSLGNVTDPHDILNKYPADSFRWFCTSEVPYGNDIKFTEEALRLSHNSDLCDKLGNLVSRALALCGGKIPDNDLLMDSKPFDIAELRNSYKDAFNRYAISEAAGIVRTATCSVNEWLTKQEPWKVKDQVVKGSIVRTLVESVYILGHFWAPFIPVAAEKIFAKLAHVPIVISELKQSNLKSGTVLPESSSVLFRVHEAEKPKVSPVVSELSAENAIFSKIDLRVGKIVHVECHPQAERLYVEKIDLGEASGPRQVLSGLRENYTLEEMKDKVVIVVANLKPRKMVGIESQGMVLCATSGDKCELIQVLGDVPLGTRITLSGEMNIGNALEAKQADKVKAWDAVAAGLRADEFGFANFSGIKLSANGFELKAPTITNAIIS